MTHRIRNDRKQLIKKNVFSVAINMPGPVLGIDNTAVNKIGKIWAVLEFI